MESYNIPDVDLLKALYEHSTVRVSPNDSTCATIRFDTDWPLHGVIPGILHGCRFTVSNHNLKMLVDSDNL
jgi:hypothetical protein